jgi:hypothetical protein
LLAGWDGNVEFIIRCAEFSAARTGGWDEARLGAWFVKGTLSASFFELDSLVYY